jgi:REP element-mobilizing transposase RayT
MKYSHIGQIALNEWEKSFALRAELFCDIFVIMPNHIHALLRIVNGNGRRDARPCVSTEPNVPTEPYIPTGIAIRQPKSISSFVAGFKSGVTVAARKTHPSFGWQPRFHDHIIRNQDEYHRIFNYITNNPANWKNDSFFNY